MFDGGSQVKHVHYDEVASKQVTEPGAEGTRVRWLIGPQDGAPGFYMRRFELAPNGCTPRHTHAWEHEVYVLEGEGTVSCGVESRPFRAGDAIYVAPEELHSFRAGTHAPVAFLCMVPTAAVP
jgi:quercetin dioxygenase-like cupin family protein